MSADDRRWRLGHRPALDAVRGLAILLVLVGHSRVPGLAGAGPVGVRLFFCLPGFLITTLLLEEFARSGRIRFTAFYARRARRLVPALLASTGLVALASLAIPWVASARDVLATLLYVGNWYLIATGSLGALVGTWSLAVEEQFYLLWPLTLLLALRAGRRWAVLVMAAGLIGSLLTRWVLWSREPESLRLSYGTDMQVDALMAGALVAVALCGRVVSLRASWWAPPAVLGLLVAASRDGAAFQITMAGWALVSSTALVMSAGLRLPRVLGAAALARPTVLRHLPLPRARGRRARRHGSGVATVDPRGVHPGRRTAVGRAVLALPRGASAATPPWCFQRTGPHPRRRADARGRLSRRGNGLSTTRPGPDVGQ